MRIFSIDSNRNDRMFGLSMNRLIISTCLILLMLSEWRSEVEAARRRCFACRSRGTLGDCKDPFAFNATTFDGIYGSNPIETQPCASGWCGKTVEDETEGPHITATERMCLLKPPSDGKERCSKTFLSNSRKTMFMCFCKGDLCNGVGSIFSNTTSNVSLATIFSIIGLILIFTLYIWNVFD